MGGICPSIATLSKGKTHKPIHKRVQCDLFAYSGGLHLKKHKLVHLRETPSKCSLCEYSPTQYGNLNRYKLIHSGEKPYKCDLCAYSSTQYDSLKKHRLIY